VPRSSAKYWSALPPYLWPPCHSVTAAVRSLPLILACSRTLRSERLATTATCWVVPKESGKVSGTKSLVDRPTTETGSAGFRADRASESANGMFLATSAWISFSSSGKSNSERQSSGRQASSGSDSEAVWHVDISGAKPMVPVRTWAW
jgi:hypothetical protein